jgi:hypothetical protein
MAGLQRDRRRRAPFIAVALRGDNCVLFRTASKGPLCTDGDMPRLLDAQFPLVAILLIGMVIAAIAPFDAAFAAATFGSFLARIGLMAVLTLIGASCADRVGMRLEGHGTRWPVLIGVAAALAVAVYVVAIDGVFFRATLPVSYVHLFEASGLRDRLTYFMLRAFNENLIYRLFVFSTLFYLISLVKGVKANALHPVLIWCAMVATQMLNIGMNVTALSPDPLSFAALFYDALRYVAPGVLWAWLYWRFGFLTAEVASVGCHVFLQPALGALL